MVRRTATCYHQVCVSVYVAEQLISRIIVSNYRELIMQEHNGKKRTWPESLMIVFIIVFITIYSFLTFWLLFDGLINQFSILHGIWRVDPEVGFNSEIQLAFFTMLGAIFGGAILSFTSFHRYVAVEKGFDIDHLWGYILAPVLNIIIGVIVYALLQSGLLVLTGSFTGDNHQVSSAFGFLAIGCIAGYNWDDFIKKLEELSKKLFKKGRN